MKNTSGPFNHNEMAKGKKSDKIFRDQTLIIIVKVCIKKLFLQKLNPHFMPKIHVEINHSIEKETAIERIKGLLQKLKAEYSDTINDIKESWNGNGASFSFKAMGMSVEGIIQVDSSLVCIDGKIPFAALPFKKTIEKTITEETIKLLK